MKKFSVLNENFTETNPGNALGITNHYTPVQNIVTNISNLFCVRLSIVATVAEDGFSVKLTSSKFTSPEAINQLLNLPLYSDVNYQQSTLNAYIMAQGLTKVNMINLGGYYVVYFMPADIKAVSTPKEVKESVLDEFEMTRFINEDEEEEEIQDKDVKKIMDLVDDGDKVKAAKQLDAFVSKAMNLPNEYYFAGVKFKNDEEAIALRWKYTKKLPHGTTVDSVRSLIYFFASGEKAVWVPDYDKDSIVNLPEEVKKMIENILDLLNASKTDDPAVFNMTGERKPRNSEDNKDDENNDDNDNEDDNKEDDSKNEDVKEKKTKSSKGKKPDNTLDQIDTDDDTPPYVWRGYKL